MFVVVIDRLRQRVMSTVRILFLLALVALLTSQLFGLFQTSRALRSEQAAPGTKQVEAGPEQVPNAAQRPWAGSLIDNLTRDLQHFYMGH